jgi:uncharacterized membrane protein (DUF2068 family)
MSWWQKLKHELGRESQPVDTIIRLIVLERSIRGGLALVLGIALLTGSRQMAHLVRAWVAELNENPGRNFFRHLLTRALQALGFLPPRTVVLIALGALAFGVLELTEAIGLARRRRWAEYLIVIAGGLGIPFELHEVITRITLLKVGILAANVAIVIYLALKKHLFVGEPQTSPPPSGGVGEASSA